MPEITAQGAVTRYIKEILYSDRTRGYHCYTYSCPQYYFRDGLFRPIDTTSLTDTVSTIGDVALRDKCPITVGIAKKDTAGEKYIGFRPDGVQNGGEQLEFSLLKVELDDKAQTVKFDTRGPVGSTGYVTGDMVVRSGRNRTMQLYPVTTNINAFKLQFIIHLKGLSIIKRDGEYWIYNQNGVFRCKIVEPKLLTADYEVIEGNYVKHSLSNNKDGTYTYTKESTKHFENYPPKAPYYIDADIIYSSTADGYVQNLISAFDWDACHDAATGTSTSSEDTSARCRIGYKSSTTTTTIRREFQYFDTTAVAGTMTAVSLFLFGFSYDALVVSVMKGTQADTLTTADFDAFTGSEYGHSGAWSDTGWNEITFNAQGILDCHQNPAKISLRDYTYDYSDTAPADETDSSSGWRTREQTGTTYDPYLSITSNGWTPRTVAIL